MKYLYIRSYKIKPVRKKIRKNLEFFFVYRRLARIKLLARHLKCAKAEIQKSRRKRVFCRFLDSSRVQFGTKDLAKSHRKLRIRDLVARFPAHFERLRHAFLAL